jgi:hypothetical protein
MAELAKNYHNNLQNRDPPPLDKDTRTVQIEAALEAIPNDQRLDDPGNSPMSRLITEDNIAKALKICKKRHLNRDGWMPIRTMEKTKTEI